MEQKYLDKLEFNKVLEMLEKYGPLDNYRFSYGPVKKYKK